MESHKMTCQGPRLTFALTHQLKLWPKAAMLFIQRRAKWLLNQQSAFLYLKGWRGKTKKKEKREILYWFNMESCHLCGIYFTILWRRSLCSISFLWHPQFHTMPEIRIYLFPQPSVFGEHVFKYHPQLCIYYNWIVVVILNFVVPHWSSSLFAIRQKICLNSVSQEMF